MFTVKNNGFKRIIIFILSILLCMVFFGYTLLFFLKIKYPTKYLEEVTKLSKEYDISPYLVFAIIKVESDFDSQAISGRGAVGLMQIMPSTAEYISERNKIENYDLLNYSDNLKIGISYLKYLFNLFNERDNVICAYNAGEGNVKQWLKDKRYSIDGKTLIKVPFKETENYKTKVVKTFDKYSNLYKKIVDKM